MTFASRIRLFLIVSAILPAGLILAVIYFHSAGQAELADERQAFQDLRKYKSFEQSFRAELQTRLQTMLGSGEFQEAVRLARRGQPDKARLAPTTYGFDFLELLDSDFNVVATFHRPGLIGEVIPHKAMADSSWLETTEYDLNGPHAALVSVEDVGGGYRAYTGVYLDESYQHRLSELLDAEIALQFTFDTTVSHSRMERATLYKQGESYRALLSGGEDAKFVLMAFFQSGAQRPVFMSLMNLTAMVGLLAALLAIALGIYITGRAKREIDNLVDATARVAAGDFTTPVMAYEEGEFSQLADSFSDMMDTLRTTRQELITSEKIAAWQAIGRKLAHEIKNPLTPIAISVDDLRRSYLEQLPDFKSTLDQTSRTIKEEIFRMTRLLDEFTKFARMNPPDIRPVNLNDFLERIRSLYGAEIERGRLVLDNRWTGQSVRIDRDLGTQVMINLIKNGLEAGTQTTVTVRLEEIDNSLGISVEDDGPGFSVKKLENPFEPYASTKPDGSGLGLIICYRIVHDHGGTIELYNRPAGGAGVKIRIPK